MSSPERFVLGFIGLCELAAVSLIVALIWRLFT